MAPAATKKSLGRPPGVSGDDSRRRLLTIAIDHLAKHGYDAMTVKNVACEAGVTSGAVYYYFPSKISLVLAAYEHSRGIVMERMRRSVEGHDTLRAQLDSLLEESIAINVESPFYSQLMIALYADLWRHPELREPLSMPTSFEMFINELVTAGKARGELRADIDALVIAELIYSCMRGLTLYRNSEQASNYRAVVQAFMAMASDGLYAR